MAAIEPPPPSMPGTREAAPVPPPREPDWRARVAVSEPELSLGIPLEHAGIDYKCFTSQLSRKRECRLYLEIGVQNGIHLSMIAAERAIGVDPDFRLSANVMVGKGRLDLHQATSDAFFAGPGHPSTLDDRFDLAFLDGFHTFEFLLRDFYNAEKVATRGALIVMHDCLPLNAEMADRDEGRAYARGENTAFPRHWTGDVWKVVPILRAHRPDLRIVCVDCPPTGLVCVTELDPASTVLESRYLDIVDEFRRVPNDLAAIASLYRDNPLVRSADVLSSLDHSLYFRV